MRYKGISDNKHKYQGRYLFVLYYTPENGHSLSRLLGRNTKSRGASLELLDLLPLHARWIQARWAILRRLCSESVVRHRDCLRSL